MITENEKKSIQNDDATKIEANTISNQVDKSHSNSKTTKKADTPKNKKTNEKTKGENNKNKVTDKKTKKNIDKKTTQHAESKLKKGVASMFTKFKLQTSKLGTNFSLAILSKPSKLYDTTLDVDIPYANIDKYGKPVDDFQTMDVHIPNNATHALPVVFFIHGGGWSSGDKAYYSEYCQKLCEYGYIIVNINYRLIPYNSLYDIVNDCTKAINFALKNSKIYKIDKKNIFLIGDSAGAHLCALLASRWTQKGAKIAKNIRALGLYYGVYDMSTLYKSTFPIVRTLDDYFHNVVGESKIADFYQRYSPVTHLSQNFPPSLIISGKIDKLFEQSASFVELLKEKGLKYETLFFSKDKKDAIHGFLNFINAKSSLTAFDKVVEFFNAHIHSKKNTKK